MNADTNPISDANEKSEANSVGLRANGIVFKEASGVGYIQYNAIEVCIKCCPSLA
jgi:hypothetical protein